MDGNRLQRYLEQKIPGLTGQVSCSPLAGGQSNPTYLLSTNLGDFVLRSKPPGKLLGSAHAIDREYRVLEAVKKGGLPVPRVLCYCSDARVFGQEFYVMEFLSGRVPKSPALEEFPQSSRKAMYQAMAINLARLHSLDVANLGLSDFGKKGGFLSRQVATWERQYSASMTEVIEDIDVLLTWLKAKLPDMAGDETTCIVHGDFRLENAVFSQDGSSLIGILDWELSTLGHPYMDLAYQCALLRLPAFDQGLSGLGGLDANQVGLPSEEDYVHWYLGEANGECIPRWDFYLALNFFRLAAICQGIKKRSIDGNASGADAAHYAARVPVFARLGRELVEQG